MQLPKHFIYLADIDSSIIQELKYITPDNFVGRPISGYEKPVCITLEIIAKALSDIQTELMSKALSLKVFDAYRPQRAVNEFIEWSNDSSDHVMKSMYYPNIN